MELSLVALFNSHAHARDAPAVNEWEARYGVPVFEAVGMHWVVHVFTLHDVCHLTFLDQEHAISYGPLRSEHVSSRDVLRAEKYQK